MANLVIYDSQYGNTEQVAWEIAAVIGGKAMKVQHFKKEALNGVALLVVGCPIHGWRPSKPVADFLAALAPNSLQGIKVAAFDTRIKGFFSGSASDSLNKSLINLGGKSIVPPGKFIVKGTEGPLVDGELENAKSWAKKILENLKD
jgi:flavodoxin